MEQEKVGIETLKQVAVALISLAKVTEDSLADGFQLTDSFAYFPVLVTLPGILKKKNDIVAEFKDLDPAERAELLSFVETTLVLSNKGLEDVVEKALASAVTIASLIESVKGLGQKSA